MTYINLADLDFDYAAQEVQQREEVQASRSELPLMTIEDVTKVLSSVPLIASYLTEKNAVTIGIAGSAGEFESATPTHIRTSGIPLRDINAFTDSSTDPTTILLRPAAHGVGTEVHEMLHALASKKYARHSWFFFDEGLTEYFTRKATVSTFDRTAKYMAENDFIERLVKIGATDDAILTQLYFAGNWAGFEKALRRFAGPFASLPLLRTANWANCLAIGDYLEELHRNAEAPLGQENAFSL
jgi:hypothetical protein